jgi:hypothetical protein
MTSKLSSMARGRWLSEHAAYTLYVAVTERTAVRSAAQRRLRLSAHRCACDILLLAKLAAFGALLCAGCKVCRCVVL